MGRGPVHSGAMGSSRRRWARRLAALALGAGALVVLELGLRLAGVAPDEVWRSPTLALIVRDGVVQGQVATRSDRYFEQVVGPDGAPAVRTAAWARGEGHGGGARSTGGMRDLRFTPEPAPRLERWAVLGGSSALGLDAGGSNGRTERLANGANALPEPQSLSGTLRSALGRAGRAVEVLNAGMIAQDADASRRIGEELLGYGVGTLVAFDGNNEAIGVAIALLSERVPATPAEVGVRRLRLFRVLADQVAPLRAWGLRGSPAPRDARDPVALARFVEAQWRTAGRALVTDGPDGPVPTDEVHAALLARYRKALTGLVVAARAAGARVIAAPTPPNLAWIPHGPLHGPGRDAAELPELFMAGRRALEAGDAEAALEAGRRAVALDPDHAMGHWIVGTALGRLGDAGAALDSLARAYALDASHRRTLRGFVLVAKEVCAEHGCVAVDLDAPLRARARAEGPAVYARLFGDHEHLTPEGNTWVGARIAEAATP